MPLEDINFTSNEIDSNILNCTSSPSKMYAIRSDIWFSCTDINAKTIDDSLLQKVTNCNYSNNTVHHRSSISDYGCCIQCTILNYYLYIKNLYLYLPHGKSGLKIPCNVPYVSFCNFIILTQKINKTSKK